MKNILLTAIAIMGFLLSATPAAYGDVPPPPPRVKKEKVEEPLSVSSPTTTATMVIEARDSKNYRDRSQLRISKTVLTQLAASTGGKKHGFLFGPQGDTVMAGMALALALALGGLWLARRVPSQHSRPKLRRTRHIVAGTAAILLTGWLGASAFADRGVPLIPKKAPEDAGLNILVEVGVMKRGKEIKLIVSPEVLKKALSVGGKSGSHRK